MACKPTPSFNKLIAARGGAGMTARKNAPKAPPKMPKGGRTGK